MKNLKEIERSIEIMRNQRPLTQQERKLKAQKETINQIIGIINSNYLESGNEFCFKCQAKILCSDCPMLFSMQGLILELKEGKHY